MPESSIELTHITLAAIRIPEMVKFYSTIFGTKFQTTQVYGGTMYHGTLAGIPFIICPNEIAGVEAKQSRHQLTFRVPDLIGLLQIVEIAGGGVHTAPAELIVSAIIRDPDGNTIEVIQV